MESSILQVVAVQGGYTELGGMPALLSREKALQPGMKVQLLPFHWSVKCPSYTGVALQAFILQSSSPHQ